MSVLSFSNPSSVDYQIHSNNDLLEWPQLLLKGARRFKVDPHFVHSGECTEIGISSPDGCLLLNHDRPIVKFNQKYNSSDDLLSLLSSFADSPSFNPADKLTVALCFKEAPDYCSADSERFQSWLRLVDDLYTRAVTGIDPNAVEFVLDGDGKPMNCLEGRWDKWNSVWINTGGPQEAFYSNSVEHDYYRFQVLNDPENVANWTWMAEEDINYGKFSDSLYPYQLWEPDAQEDILKYIDIYRSGAEHSPGFHFAINVDVAMFRLYARDATGKALNVPITGTDGAAGPVITRFPTNDKVFCNMVTYGMPSGDVSYSILCPRESLNAAFPSELDMLQQSIFSPGISSWLLGEKKAALVATDVLASSGLNTLLVLSNTGLFTLVNISNSNFEVFTTYKGSFETSDEDEEIFFDGKLGSCKELAQRVTHSNAERRMASSLCAIVASSIISDNGEMMMIRVYELSVDSPSPILLSELSVSLPNPASERRLSSARIANFSKSDAVVFCAFDGVVYGTSLVTSSEKPRWVALSVGGEISVSEANGVLMLITDFGYCFNSHRHNTRSYPTVCAATPVPSDTVLDYSIGLVSSWVHILMNSACVYEPDIGAVCTEISPCHSSILHGTYNQGSHPAVAIDFHNDGNRTDYFFLEVHRGLSSTDVSKLPSSTWLHDSLSDQTLVEDDIGQENGCGIPLLAEGLVGDSFDISEWIIALEGQHAV